MASLKARVRELEAKAQPQPDSAPLKARIAALEAELARSPQGRPGSGTTAAARPGRGHRGASGSRSEPQRQGA